MKTTLSKAARAAGAALLLCAAFGAARAQQLDEPTANPGALVLIPSVGDGERDEQDATRALDGRRQKMMVDCEQNNGVDCEREVDTELRAERALRGAPRQEMIEDCEQNNGTDCERETDTELRAEGLQWGARIIHLRPAR